MNWLYLLIFLMIRNPTIPAPTDAGVVSPIERAAHLYHNGPNGLVSIEDPDGTQFFYRGGQRCKLFTDAFMKEWNQRREYGVLSKRHGRNVIQ